MCNHVYRADYSSRPRSLGRQCPYPAFFAGLPDAGPDDTLPLDGTGACIFHSEDIAWKRANDLPGRFIRLIALLNAHGTERHGDFAEFVLVGAEGTTWRGKSGHVLRIADTVFTRQPYFISARFVDAVEMERVDFPNGAEFDGSSFLGDLTLTDAATNGFSMMGTRLERTWFVRTEFRSYALFPRARFTGTSNGGFAVNFQDCVFRGLADFSDAEFELRDDSTVAFERVRFEEHTDFRRTRFKCHAEFRFVTVADITDFIDTSFEVVGSAARYVGAAAEFTGIGVTEGGTLTFMSSDPAKKLFDHDVEMIFTDAELAGSVRFENVNFNQIIPSSRGRLLELARLGRIVIGPGCIKYRVQTDIRTVPVDPGNAALVVELCQTFTTYFTASQGLNLGFEVVSRDREKVRFFYFTDEDISEAEFLERLERTERDLWNLLSIASREQLVALPGTGDETEAARESAAINAVDGLSALMGTFFRVGIRIAVGRWKAADTRALLGAIEFNDDGAALRAALLHRTLSRRYTDAALIGLNREQNALLSPIAARRPDSGRVRILFLGANSLTEPLDLEREYSRIQTSLKLGREGDGLELKQVWAVTVDTLLQAMLDESPAFVHFSGHGDEQGIFLRDDAGGRHTVAGEALADLFALFSGTVRCVVLNSCYSLFQARAIRRHVPHVVGISSEIPDPASLAFSTGFYTAIAAGKDIPFAFGMGKTSVRMHGEGGEDLLALL